MKTAYKIVTFTIEKNTFEPYYAPRWTATYTIGQETKRRSDFGALCLFDSLANVERFLARDGGVPLAEYIRDVGLAILECTYTESTLDFVAFQDNQRHYKAMAEDLPKGTVLADSLTPIARLM